MPASTLTVRRPLSKWAKYGPWAVVTGASDGIGRACATELAAGGLNLILVARRECLLASLADSLRREHGIETKVLAMDLSSREGVGVILDQTAALDVGLLVAAAGFGTSGRFIDGDPAEEAAMLTVNCSAVTLLSFHFARQFAKRGGGGVVLFGSLVGWQGVPYSAHYAATKAYVQTLAEGLHVELAASKVDVLVSAPGPVSSGFADRAGMRMGAAVRPAEVARSTLAALGRGRTTVVPGALSKLLTYTLLPLPRAGRVRMMARIMKGMTKHRDAGVGSQTAGSP